LSDLIDQIPLVQRFFPLATNTKVGGRAEGGVKYKILALIKAGGLCMAN
jgi:hypothetical protein